MPRQSNKLFALLLLLAFRPAAKAADVQMIQKHWNEYVIAVGKIVATAEAPA